MAKCHGLETAVLFAALSACSSGNKVAPPAVSPVSPAIFEDIRGDIQSLQSIQDVCEASGAGTVLCKRQNGNTGWTFTAVPKGEKLLVITGKAEEVDWDLRVEGSCTNDMAGVVLTGAPPPA